MIKLFKIIGAILTVILITTVSPVMAQAPTETKVLSVKETIAFYAEQNGANKEELLKVAKCESSFNPKATGDGGRAKNIFQYHYPTFVAFSKLMGEDLDYHSYTDQSKLTSWIWVHYPQYKKHWTCYSMLY